MQAFKSWSKLEKWLLFSSMILILLVGFIFKAKLTTTLSSIIGIITALLLAKGKNLGQILGLICALLYSFVSLKNRFYGEVIIYMCIMLPMYLIGILLWIRHQNKKTDTVQVNNIKLKEWIVVSIVCIFAFIGIYWLLKTFETKELLISSLSVVSSLFAIYLGIRRCKYSFYFYIINDFILIMLWGIPVINGTLSLFPMLFNPIINFINDSYGIYNWNKLELIQKQIEK